MKKLLVSDKVGLYVHDLCKATGLSESQIITRILTQSGKEVLFQKRDYVIDESPEGNARMSQTKHILKFNSKKRIMFANPDFLDATEPRNKHSLTSLLRSMNSFTLLTSTRTTHTNHEKCLADITHYFGSTVRKPIVHERVVVPVLRGELLSDVLKDKKEGLPYIQAWTGKNYCAAQFEDVFGKLNPKRPFPYDKYPIKVWTSTMEDRIDYAENASRFSFFATVFELRNDLNPDRYDGYSYRARVSEFAKRTASK